MSNAVIFAKAGSNRLDPWPRCRHSREGGNPVYFGLHAYNKSVWIPAFAGMTVAGSKRLRRESIAFGFSEYKDSLDSRLRENDGGEF